MIPTIYPRGLSIALSLVGYNSLLASLFVFFKRHDRIGGYYLLSSLFTFGWGVGMSFMVNNDLPPAVAQSWAIFAQVCLFLIPAAWLHFISVYLEKEKRRYGNLVLAYGVTLFFLAFAGTSWFVSGFREIAGIRNMPVPGPAYKALTVFWVVLMLDAFSRLLKFWRRQTSVLKKDDARFLFFTQLYGYGLCGLCFLPVYGVPMPQYQFFLLPLWQVFLAFAMVRNHLLSYETLAKAMHQEKLAGMSTLTASMHHELKNPLTAIRVFAEYLPEKYDDPEFRNNFKGIVIEEVDRVTGILHQLLDYSKPQEPELKKVCIVEVLDETLLFLNHTLIQQGVEVVKNYQEAPWVNADRNQMKQVFLNLLLNGLQAMEKGGSFRIEGRPEGDKQFVIKISDTGAGIPKEHLKQLFDPFFTTKTNGTGLGLSIVQRIMKKHGGDIQIQSVAGQGTDISLIFKVSKR